MLKEEKSSSKLMHAEYNVFVLWLWSQSSVVKKIAGKK